MAKPMWINWSKRQSVAVASDAINSAKNMTDVGRQNCAFSRPDYCTSGRDKLDLIAYK